MTVSEVRLMYWAYYVAGGVYTYEEFSTRFKCYWFAINFGTVCIAAACGIGYCITVISLNPLDSAIVLSLSVAAIGFPIIVTLVTWYCRSDLEKLLRCIEHASDAANRRNKSFFHSRILVWVVLVYTLGMALISIPALDLLFTPRKEILIRTERYHIIGVPYMDCIPSELLYWAAYFLEFSLLGFVIFMSFAEPFLILAITFQLNDIALSYCKRLKALDKVDASFDIELVSLIQEYQALINSLQLVRSYIQIFGSLLVPSLFQILANQTFVFLLTVSSFFLKVRLSIVAIMCLLYLYAHCKFGTTMNELKEEIVRNVYGLPWYKQPPKIRKTLYIFLNQVQRPLTFNAFRVISIDMTLIPKILRVTYSLANVLAASLSYEGR